jgi:Peptidase family M23
MRLFLTTLALFTAFLSAPGAARADWVWPLQGELITTYRNGDDPYAGGQHRGIDIAGPVGERVVAASGGEVRFAGTAGSSGLTVSVRTGDGRFDTSYLHLSSISVRAGQQVSAGETLGAVGTTGSRSAAEPHLHFGVREAGSRHAYRNPLDFLPPRSAPPPPEAPKPTPVPAPTPAAPAPSPVAERAPQRVPAGRRTPRGAPAGERAPHRVPAGEPAPRRVPGRAPRALPGRAPRSAPAGQPAPRGLPVGDLAPTGAPAHAPIADPDTHHHPLADRGPGRVPGAAPSTGHAALEAPSNRGAPDLAGLAPGSDGQPASAVSGVSRDRASGTEPSAFGPDIGWILACVGLLVAAGILGLTEDGRKATRTGHGRVVRLLRPLTGRG